MGIGISMGTEMGKELLRILFTKVNSSSIISIFLFRQRVVFSQDWYPFQDSGTPVVSSKKVGT